MLIEAVGQPVEHETGGKFLRNMKVKMTGIHCIILAWAGSAVVAGLNLVLQDHQGAHDDWKDIIGVARGEVMYPEDPWLAVQLPGTAQGVEERDEDGHLQEHRQAASQRVGAGLLVELHHLGVEAERAPLLYFCCSLRDLGLQLLHGGGGFEAFVGQRE